MHDHPSDSAFPQDSTPPVDPPPWHAGYGQAPGSYPPLSHSSSLRQVSVLGVLLIIEGALELLMAATTGYAAANPQIMQQAMSQFAIPGFDAEAMTRALMIQAMICGGAGLLRLAGAAACFTLRGRALAIVSLFLGLVTAMTCYCAPFSLGLLIYGLIILLNSDVAYAYQLRAQGYTRYQIAGS